MNSKLPSGEKTLSKKIVQRKKKGAGGGVFLKQGTEKEGEANKNQTNTTHQRINLVSGKVSGEL